MGRRSCPSCGASLGIGSRACDACGFDPAPPPAPVEPSLVGALAPAAPTAPAPADDASAGEATLHGDAVLGAWGRSDASGDDDVDDEVDDAEAEGEPPRRGRRAALGVLAVVGLLAVTAAVVGRDEGAGPRQAAREAATSTAAATSTTVRPTISTRSVTSFTDIRLGVPLSPVPTGGTVLYGLSVAGQVVRIDLDAGSVQARLLRGPNGEQPGASFRIVARDGTAFLADDEGDVLVVPDGDATSLDWRGGWGKLVPGDRPDQVWHITGDLSGDRRAVLETLDGTPVGPVLAMPPGSVVQGSDRAGGIQYDNLGQRYRVNPDRPDEEELASTPLLATNDAVIVRVDCPELGRCVWAAVARPTGTAIGSGDAPLALVVPGPPAVLSPDNRYLARVSGQNGEATLTVLDLVGGTAQTFDGDLQLSQPPVWTATGNQLLFLSARGELYRLDAATGDFEAMCGTCFRPLLSLDAVAPTPLAAPVPVPSPTLPPSADVTALLPVSPALAVP